MDRLLAVCCATLMTVAFAGCSESEPDYWTSKVQIDVHNHGSKKAIVDARAQFFDDRDGDWPYYVYLGGMVEPGETISAKEAGFLEYEIHRLSFATYGGRGGLAYFDPNSCFSGKPFRDPDRVIRISVDLLDTGDPLPKLICHDGSETILEWSDE